jgi:1,2-dihydroxy-3-keto-5-methylthiopentene dioxygenase
MTRLRIFAEDQPEAASFESSEFPAIQSRLATAGVRFERWQASADIQAGATQDAVIAAYRADIDRLLAEAGYQAVDVISLTPAHPDKATLRSKFLNEHTHAEDEVRFFVDGRGLFTLHLGAEVFEILCEKNDLIGVPAGTRHWFDMGPEPSFVAIRVFTNPAGWVADFTGSDIALRFPRLAPA